MQTSQTKAISRNQESSWFKNSITELLC